MEIFALKQIEDSIHDMFVTKYDYFLIDDEPKYYVLPLYF